MSFKENGYVLIKNVLSNEICKLATQYALFEQMNDVDGKHLEGATEQVPGTHSVYSDSLMESFLLFLKPVAEKHSELNLIPTYSYYRIYKPGDILVPHTDRPSCEITMSITLGFRYNSVSENYKWPIFVENNPIIIEEGDAFLYKGCEKKHWRDALKVDKKSYHVQLFLHYVDANGPYAKEYKYDGRPTIGIKKENIR
jgi:hypothetical protein